MSKLQIWVLLLILFIAVIGFLFLTYWSAIASNSVAEKRAWVDCIKEHDQASAGNLVCRSQYPEPYKLFYKEYNQ